MSLSPNPDGSGFVRQQQGKTPPPAPSAAYARRAREIQAEEGLGGRYRPPALRTSQSALSENPTLGIITSQNTGSSSASSGTNNIPSSTPTLNTSSAQLGPPSAGVLGILRPTLTPIDSTSDHAAAFSLPASYRRARAGTLPSNVQLAAQNYSASLSNGSGGLASYPENNSSLASSLASSPITSAPPISAQNMLGARPSLRHAATMAPSPASALGNSATGMSGASGLGGGVNPAMYSSGAGVVGGVSVGGERTSRLRSGSLTLPTGGLTDAFGPSIFSSSWLANSSTGGPGGGIGTLDELRSLGSGESHNGEEYDIHTVHTLDYLGLDDDSRRGSVGERSVNGTSGGIPGHHGHHVPIGGAPRMVEMRDPSQMPLGTSSASNRIRANTVANPYRRTTARSTRITEPTHDEDELEYSTSGNEYGGQQPSNNLGVPSYSRQRIDSYDGSGYVSGGSNSATEQQYIARGFPKSTAEHLASSARSRSTSLGTADEQGVRRRVNVGMIDEQPMSAGGSYTTYRGASTQDYSEAPLLQQPQYNVLHSQQQQSGAPSNPLLRQLHIDTMNNQPGHVSQSNRSASSPSVRFPSAVEQSMRNSSSAGNLGVHGGVTHRDGRAVSPKDGSLTGGVQSGNGATQTQIQTPSRSLWIGNLDSSVSGEDLARAFAPYGAIESFRLLPEKECGFINFVDIADAIRAKDDVLNRLGGTIGQANGQTVRIGFGKADSAPATPSGPNSGGTHSSHFLTSNSNASPRDVTGPTRSASGDNIDAQLQSTPTRALWIGSIPSTTTPATILSVFSPFGPIESARVLTHKNCGFVNFERLDDAVRARKALNGRDVLGSDVGAIRIGFARVPVKSGSTPGEGEEGPNNGSGIQGVGDLSVGATIHTLRGIKGASAVPADQQVLGGAVENYRSNLLLSMLSQINQVAVSSIPNPVNGTPVTEQQMIMKMLGDGAGEQEADLSALAEFRPPMAYYTTIPVAAERTNSRRWDASKLRELRKRLDSGSCTIEEIDDVASDFLDGEIVDLASDWLGNTVVQKLFEKCSPGPRIAMLERVAPNLAMIGIHKNGTWAAQKVIECANTPEEITLIAINLRPYTPPLLLDQFGNYVVQCCLRFGYPANEFIFDAMTDRLWEIAQGRFGARSMRTCLESPYITMHQQRRIATAVILNSIPLATNPNGALLLTWLLDTSGFHNRYRLLAPRFTPHLSHLCTHKLASVTVLRIVNQKSEPEASTQIVQALFFSPNDHVLSDVLGDQINGVAVVHKILQSPFLDQAQRPSYLDATKRVLIDLKVTTAQAYRRLIEEVGLPIPSFAANAPTHYTGSTVANGSAPKKTSMQQHSGFGGPQQQGPQHSGTYSPDLSDPALTHMMASMQISQQHQQQQGGRMPQQGPAPGRPYPPMQGYPQQPHMQSSAAFSPASDPFLPLPLRGEMEPSSTPPQQRGQYAQRGNGIHHASGGAEMYDHPGPVYGTPPSMPNGAHMHGSPMTPMMGQPHMLPGMEPMPMPGSPYAVPAPIHPQMYQAYMYQLYQQQQLQQPPQGSINPHNGHY